MKGPRIIVAALFCFALLVVSAIYVSEKNRKTSRFVCKDYELAPTVVLNQANRGVIILNDSLAIWSAVEIISGELRSNEYMQRKVSPGDNYPDYDLENLKRPFFIFKTSIFYIQKGSQ